MDFMGYKCGQRSARDLDYNPFISPEALAFLVLLKKT
jgi:hypothetical protein